MRYNKVDFKLGVCEYNSVGPTTPGRIVSSRNEGVPGNTDVCRTSDLDLC